MSMAWETAFTRRSGYGAFPLTQTIRLGAFGGVGAIYFGRRRDVAGHCNDLIPCRARIYYDWRGARLIFRTLALRAGCRSLTPLRHSRPKNGVRATSARDDARSGRPLALTSHRTRSDFPSGAAPDRVYRPEFAGGVANKKYVWYSVGLQGTVFTVRLEF